jgi:hypothetical protein
VEPQNSPPNANSIAPFCVKLLRSNPKSRDTATPPAKAELSMIKIPADFKKPSPLPMQKADPSSETISREN